jgi:hypothetical protein
MKLVFFYVRCRDDAIVQLNDNVKPVKALVQRTTEELDKKVKALERSLMT